MYSQSLTHIFYIAIIIDLPYAILFFDHAQFPCETRISVPADIVLVRRVYE